MNNQQNEQRAGGIVYRRIGPETEYLLVTSNSNKNRWIFPAGHVEPGETHDQTALREVAEEAGVSAVVVAELGNYQYFWYHDNRKVLIDTCIYLMQYIQTTDTHPEGRQVGFFSYEDILKLNLWEESKEFMVKANQVVTKLT